MNSACDSIGAEGLESMVGISPWVEELRAAIRRIAPYCSSVLVSGPSGSGKELIARAVHALSGRAAQTFVPIDCASITGTLFASHMFGHVKGAFTGASHAALGGFRAADGGTIFLDEIGELEPELQAKLLRVLQQRTVVPVGSYEEIPVDVRVIAATNRDLAAAVTVGRFREDLYWRLNVVRLMTLPLCDHPEDIEVLTDHIFAKLSIRHGLPLKRLSSEARALVRTFPWPGNVRQLENVLERATLYSDRDVIDPDTLSRLADADRTTTLAPAPDGGPGTPPPTASPADRFDGCSTNNQDEDPWMSIAELERSHILRTLEHTFYNQSAAARLLRIDRNHLRRKINRYGIDIVRAKTR